MPTELKLPELADNITEVQVTKVLVAAGDRVALEQPLIEMETGKATVEFPSPVQGTIRRILVKEGDKLQVGGAFLLYDAEEGATVAPPSKLQATGMRSMEGGASGREEGRRGVSSPPSRPEHGGDKAPPSSLPPPPAPVVSSGKSVIAAPSVRTFAREIGIDITRVPPSGQGGRVTIEDVKQFSRRFHTTAPAPVVAEEAPSPSKTTLPDFSKWGPIEREPFNTVRRATAEHMTRAWTEIPHVTQHDEADITALEALRKRYLEKARSSGGKLTLTAILIKVVEAALKAHPKMNASIDMAGGQVIYKKYCHIGVAVDTPRGLLVPVIRDVERKNIIQISTELVQLVEKARTGKLGIEDLQGGTFTLTNLGGIGGSFFTPIINWPQVAILGVGRSLYRPMMVDDKVQSRLMLPLSLSYDHRLIDGADGARFLRWIVDAINEPLLLALEG
jgi:pyruvate dehydrogenase E2 component (dihydrolipoamide acetyltransferase)